LLNSRGEIPWTDRVRPDHNYSGRKAFSYLMEKQSDAIFMVNMTPEHPAWKMQRYGFIEAAQDIGKDIEMLELSSVEKGKSAENNAQFIAAKIAEAKNRCPVGVFFVQDTAAARIYMALHQIGHSPDRWLNAICCGIDDMILGGLYPKPATFDVRACTVGRRAVAQLLWRIRSRSLEDTMTIMVTPKLITW
jgi:DNA-binding LacI/PurR family transcriptional regulator